MLAYTWVCKKDNDYLLLGYVWNFNIYLTFGFYYFQYYRMELLFAEKV